MKVVCKLFTAVLLLAITGCAIQISLDKPWRLPEPSGPEDALIVGRVFVGAKNGPIVPDLVRILRYGRVYAGLGLKAIGEPHNVFSDGRFVVRVKPGKFLFKSFYANQDFYYIAKESNEKAWFTVRPGQVYYVGSYQAKFTDPGRFFTTAKFRLEPVKSPGKRELLQWLTTISQGTGWEKRVRKQLI